MTFKELTGRATERPWHTDGDGQIFGPNPEFDPTDLQTHDEILIADVAPENVALTEYDVDNAALIVHCANTYDELLEMLIEMTSDACAVVDNWEKGDLAGAVRNLDHQIDCAKLLIERASNVSVGEEVK